jgi:type VI secretion system protein ImpH
MTAASALPGQEPGPEPTAPAVEETVTAPAAIPEEDEDVAILPAPLPGRTLLQTLIEEPARFTFDAAVAVLMQAAGRAEPGEAVRFHATSGLGFVPADVMAVERDGNRARATIGLIGLTGPSGVLPRPYTDLVNTEQRRRSPALGEFLDLLAQRPIAQFAQAGIKYRPHRSAAAAALADGGMAGAPADGLRQVLLALTGYGTPHLAPRLAVGTDPLLFYAGLFASWPRSADRLAAILSDWLGRAVVVEQFAGEWLPLKPDEMSAFPVGDRPGQFCQLGVDAAAGSRAWDVQARIILHIGPLDLPGFEAMLPDRDLLQRITALTRAFLGFETDFAVNPILAAASVPALEVSAATPPRLGWNSWLPTTGTRRHDATEALFEAGLIESFGEGS